MNKEEINEVICTYIKKYIVEEENNILDCEKNLFTYYGVDSITIIELIMYLEEKYGVQFDLINLNLVELRSIDGISNNVKKMIEERKK